MTKRNLLSFAALLFVLVLAPRCAENGGSPRSAQPQQQDPSAPTDALGQMEIAFVGGHSRASIKARLEKAMTLYGLPINEENYSRAGSALVGLRKDNNIAEMDILNHMIRSHVDGVNMSFADAAGLSAAFLAAERK